MDAATFVQNLIKLGSAVKDAWGKDGKPDWETFLKSSAFKDISTTLKDLVAMVSSSDNWKAAVDAVDQKRLSLLAGRKVHDLSWEELVKYDNLAAAREALTKQAVIDAAETPTFWQWLASDLLPTLIDVAPVLIPLLL